MITINKNQAKQLTKVIYQLKRHNIPLDDVLVGLNGQTMQTIDTRLQAYIMRK